jgi:hypothetical protein
MVHALINVGAVPVLLIKTVPTALTTLPKITKNIHVANVIPIGMDKAVSSTKNQPMYTQLVAVTPNVSEDAQDQLLATVYAV